MSKPKKVLHVEVRLSVTVDVEGWRREYGSPDTATEIREAVKGTVDTAARSAFHHIADVVRVRSQ